MGPAVRVLEQDVEVVGPRENVERRERRAVTVRACPAPRRELWQLCTRLSMTFAVAGVLLGLGGHWPLAYALFGMGRAGFEPATLGLKVPCSTN